MHICEECEYGTNIMLSDGKCYLCTFDFNYKLLDAKEQSEIAEEVGCDNFKGEVK